MSLRAPAILLWAAALSGLACEVVHAQPDVVAVVSAKNPVGSLTTDQLSDIYLGRSSHFPNGTAAQPCDLLENSPLRDEFYRRLLGKTPAQVKAYWARMIFTGRGQPPREVQTSEDAKRLVAENINAVCYIDRAQVDSSVNVVAPR